MCLAAVCLLAACGETETPGPTGKGTTVAHGAAGFAPATRPRRKPPDPALAARLAPEDRPLLPFFAALESIETGAAAQPVEVIQLGDSHTANDSFSAQLRRRLQARFGDAGRGLLPAGIPFRSFLPEGAEVTLGDGWDQVAWFNPAGPPPFDISGVRITTAQAGATMGLAATGGETIEDALVEIVRQPGGGTLELQGDGGTAVPLATAGRAEGGEIYRLALPAGTHRLDLRARGDGPVSLLSWGYERRGPGIVYLNHGTIGATASVLDNLDPPTLQREMAFLDPALILVVFGTNEGFAPHVDPDDYAAEFTEKIRVLRQSAPDAAILVVGPPDAARLTSRPDGLACTAMPLPKATKKPAKKAVVAPQWRTPPMLAVVRAAQRGVAAREGVFFWDWEAAMGGACSMVRFVAEGKALADHVHMRSAGYHETADALFDRLMQGYETYRGGRVAAR